jgi:hypothetical protein
MSYEVTTIYVSVVFIIAVIVLAGGLLILDIINSWRKHDK